MKFKHFVSISKFSNIDRVINKWVNQNPLITIKDVKFSTVVKDNNIIDSALILYEETEGKDLRMFRYK